MNDFYTVDLSVINYPEGKISNTAMHKSEDFSMNSNQTIVKSGIRFLKNSEHFTDPLF